MAKKSKAFSELLRLQKMSQGSEKPLKSFEKKLREKSLPFKEIVVSPSGEVTMSEVLEDFIEPYRESNETKGSMRTLLTIGIIAWNLALSPESKRQEMIDRVFNKDLLKGDKRLKADIQGLIDELIARKNRYFSENKRMIVDFELKELGSEYHLSVASSLSPEFSESEFAFKVGDSVIVKQGVLDPARDTEEDVAAIIEQIESNIVGAI